MSCPFSPSSNLTFAVVVVLVGVTATVCVAVPMIYVRLPVATEQGRGPEQPIPFDHRHHAGHDQIDCLYCHPAAARRAKADLPTTERCMGCHQQIWTTSPMLAPVRDSFSSGKPIVWQRVNQLPDFVYFNHAVHVHAGVACVTCHGRVDQMARVVQEASLLMSWCLDCHRAPEGNLRPPALVTDMTWQPTVSFARHELPAVAHPTYCSACHR